MKIKADYEGAQFTGLTLWDKNGDAFIRVVDAMGGGGFFANINEARKIRDHLALAIDRAERKAAAQKVGENA